MDHSLEVLKTALSEFFKYQFYSDGISALREALIQNEYYKANWEAVSRSIIERTLPIGVPLDIIHHNANLPLDENSDEEAYRWLDLMLLNAKSSSSIIEY